MAQSPQKPDEKGMVNDPKDPTQRLPPHLQSGDMDDQRVREQQHTGNHHKPGPEERGSDLRGGTRAGAENVEPTDRPDPKEPRTTG